MDSVWNYVLVLGGAALLGGLIGLERELRGGWAGLRTHMMVAMGAALFVQAGMEASGSNSDAVSRIIQGIAAGVGFIGAGTILKLASEREIQGLTTASSVWFASAVGSACGIGLFLPASIGAVLSVIILYALGRLERHFPAPFKHHRDPDATKIDPDPGSTPRKD